MGNALALCVPHAGYGRGSRRYDVCLSFPGGSNASPEGPFLGRLCASLAAEGVSVCVLNASQAVCSSPQLPGEVIRRSKICIPILSEDCASSEQCLSGLVRMMEGKRSARQAVLPIFDGVEPSDVRNQRGSFGKAILPFDGAEIEEVTAALSQVGYICGWKMTEWGEEELVERVVQTVLGRLRPDLHNVSQSTRYNVFLNFRGTDTRHGIVFNLYKGLTDAGVSVFKDDTDLVIGEDFPSQLGSAISRSTIYITVLSPTYAYSKWCLRELMEMVKCEDNMGHVFLPIYYEVSPSDVRHQRGSFEEAIRLREMRHDSHEDIMEGKQALRHVSSISGWGWQRYGQIEEEKIKRVVKEVLRYLGWHFQLDVREYVSIDDRVKSDFLMRC